METLSTVFLGIIATICCAGVKWAFNVQGKLATLIAQQGDVLRRVARLEEGQ